MLLIIILLSVAVIAPAWCADKQGTEKNPFKGKGPVNQWVTNGKWMMRVTAVQSIESMQAAEALPWTKRLTQKKKDVIRRWLKYLYEGEGKLVLVTLEVKNIGDRKVAIGTGAPRWYVRTDDGQQSQAGDSVAKGKVSPGSRRDITGDLAFCLKGGFPQNELLNPGAKTGGVIPMAIPSYAEARLFYFLHGGSEPYFGKNESLVIELQAK